MQRAIKLILFILIISFWFFGTYLFTVGARMRVVAEIGTFDDFIFINQKILNGSYPLKSEVRVAFFDRLINVMAANPDLRMNPSFLIIFNYSVLELQKEPSNNLWATLQLAQAFAIAGLREKSIEMMNRAIILGPKKQTTLWTVFGLLKGLGDEEQAKRTLQHLNDISPTFINNVSR